MIARAIAAIFGGKRSSFIGNNPARVAAQAKETTEALGWADPVYTVARGVPVMEDGRRIINYRIEPGKTYTDPEAAKAACIEWRKVYPDAIVVESIDMCPDKSVPSGPTVGYNAEGERTLTYTDSQLQEQLDVIAGRWNAMQTQADGRAFALALFSEGDGANDGGACPYNPYAATTPDATADEFALYREGPQWPGIHNKLEDFYKKASNEARKGFASIVTDLVCNGGISDDHLRILHRDEAAGRHQDFGQPGSVWEYKTRDPKFAEAVEETESEDAGTEDSGDDDLPPSPPDDEPEKLAVVTEKQGRVFAIYMLENCESLRSGGENDQAVVNPTSDPHSPEDPGTHFRSGPQWSFVQQCFAHMRTNGTERAWRGFAAILTDALTSDVISPEIYLRDEAAGKNQVFGMRGDTVPLPAQVTAPSPPASIGQETTQIELPDEYGDPVDTMPLATQADGRKYAIYALQCIEAYEKETKDRARDQGVNETIANEFVACPVMHAVDSYPAEYQRISTQYEVLTVMLERVCEEGTSEARKGFGVMLTDFIGNKDTIDSSVHEANERDRFNQDYGVRGDAMPLERRYAISAEGILTEMPCKGPAAPKAKRGRKANAERGEAVSAFEEGCNAGFVTLHEICGKYGKADINPVMMPSIWETVRATIEPNIAAFAAKVPASNKRTHAHLRTMLESLKAGTAFAYVIAQDGEGMTPQTMDREAEARVMFMFASRASTAMEEAGSVFSKRTNVNYGWSELTFERPL